MNPVATTFLVQAAFVLLASGWRTVAQTRATGSTDPQRALAKGEPTVDLRRPAPTWLHMAEAPAL